MELVKRECNVKMRLIPYGAGWTDFYADFGDGELYFILSNSMGSNYSDLVDALYYMYPDQNDYVEPGIIEYKIGVVEEINGERVVTKIYDRYCDDTLGCTCRDIPWRTSFSWDEEGSWSHWTLERVPDTNTEFSLKISIDIDRSEAKHYEYEVPYKDMCYAVADAYTKALKKHGFWGYHYATFTDDVNVRQLLFLKSIALGNMEARTLTYYDEKGMGETSDFDRELELLLFDM